MLSGRKGKRKRVEEPLDLPLDVILHIGRFSDLESRKCMRLVSRALRIKFNEFFMFHMWIPDPPPHFVFHPAFPPVVLCSLGECIIGDAISVIEDVRFIRRLCVPLSSFLERAPIIMARKDIFVGTIVLEEGFPEETVGDIVRLLSEWIGSGRIEALHYDKVVDDMLDLYFRKNTFPVRLATAKRINLHSIREAEMRWPALHYDISICDLFHLVPEILHIPISCQFSGHCSGCRVDGWTNLERISIKLCFCGGGDKSTIRNLPSLKVLDMKPNGVWVVDRESCPMLPLELCRE